MISLTCTSCQKVLQIDDAFAGGVCRCQYCGTIQTVPAALKKAGSAPAGKTLYQKKTRQPGQSSSGLEDLSESLGPSSGLARGMLKAGRAVAPVPPPPPASRKNLLPIFVAISIVLAIAVIVLLWLLLHH